MPNGYSRSPKLLKGALVEFSERFIAPIPNIIVFQYNPDTLSRSLSPWVPPEIDEKGFVKKASGMKQPSHPNETFTLSLELDATDALEEPESHPVAVVSGVADRISALELLCYPQEDIVEEVKVPESKTVKGDSVNGNKYKLKAGSVPVVLFSWGLGRLVPVRLTSFSVEEQAFSTTLYPIRAKVSVGLKVMLPSELAAHHNKTGKDIAIAAYGYTHKQKKALATSNVANNVESIMGLLSF